MLLENRNIMVDIETLGTDLDAVIASIGAVAFTRNSIRDKFKRNINFDQKWRSFSASTLEWWFHQNELALKALFDPKPVDLDHALRDFILFVKKSKPQTIWANGITFDIPILRSAIHQCGRDVPWKYSKEMCLRPIRFIGNEIDLNYREFKKASGLILHDSLSDAIIQAEYLMAVVKKLEI